MHLSRHIISRATSLGLSRRLAITRRTMSNQKPLTAYTASKDLPPQTQEIPGMDANMHPTAEHAKQEFWDENGKPYLYAFHNVRLIVYPHTYGRKEYLGTGKLENKKALITGGDSVRSRSVVIYSLTCCSGNWSICGNFFCSRRCRCHNRVLAQ